jgi:hypothetical protein
MSDFSLLTLNCFGIPFSRGRLGRLATVLGGRHPPMNMLCFQEVQQHSYRRILLERLPDYPYNAVDQAGPTPGGGLLTVANVPLENWRFMPYQNRGRMLSVGVADWLLGKGILETVLRVEDQLVVVLNTHLQANYQGVWQQENRLAQIQYDQVLQLVDTVLAQPDEAIVVVCGDFNFPRQSFSV